MSKSATFYMTKTGEKLEWMPCQKVMYDAFVRTVKEDQTVCIKMQINRPRKTLPQLGYWYGVLIPFTRDELIKLGYNTLELSVREFSTPVDTDVDSVDNLLKSLFQAYKMMPLKPQKRKMTVDDMSELIEFTLKWLADNLGVFAPAPDSK